MTDLFQQTGELFHPGKAPRIRKRNDIALIRIRCTGKGHNAESQFSAAVRQVTAGRFDLTQDPAGGTEHFGQKRIQKIGIIGAECIFSGKQQRRAGRIRPAGTGGADCAFQTLKIPFRRRSAILKFENEFQHLPYRFEMPQTHHGLQTAHRFPDPDIKPFGTASLRGLADLSQSGTLQLQKQLERIPLQRLKNMRFPGIRKFCPAITAL